MAKIRSTINGDLFRPQQSFSIFTARQLLDKLEWDLDQLEQLRWDEGLGRTWRQVVSYKAMDCAMTIWHMAEWFSHDLNAVYPIEGICHFLDIKDHDPFERLSLKKLRSAAVKKCPELEICRIIANASKHYEIDHNPRPDVQTSCYLSVAHRGDEAFMRPVMWLTVQDSGERRELRKVFHTCYVFWRHLAYAGRPGDKRPSGEPLPVVELPAYRSTADVAAAPLSRPSLVQRVRNAFNRR